MKKIIDQRLFCDEPDCERPLAGHGRGKCAAHLKQLQRHGKTVPIVEKMSPEERAIEAGSAMLDADSDEEYKTKRRSWLIACKALGRTDDAAAAAVDIEAAVRRQRSLEVRNGLEGARARGVRLGRPPKVPDERLRELLQVCRTGAALARVLAMNPASINARLAKMRGK